SSGPSTRIGLRRREPSFARRTRDTKRTGFAKRRRRRRPY
ncbi:hypothetical protein MPH_13748, partial [Macrophomina phaseolina MS6]